MIKDFQTSQIFNLIADNVINKKNKDFRDNIAGFSVKYLRGIMEDVIKAQGYYVKDLLEKKQPIYLPFLGRFKIHPIREVYLDIWDRLLSESKKLNGLDYTDRSSEEDLLEVALAAEMELQEYFESINHKEELQIKINKFLMIGLKFPQKNLQKDI